MFEMFRECGKKKKIHMVITDKEKSGNFSYRE